MVELLGSVCRVSWHVRVFVQAFPASGDPIPVSGFFWVLVGFFFLSLCLVKASEQDKEDRQGRSPHEVKNRDGKLGCSSVTLLYTSPDSCSNSA